MLFSLFGADLRLTLLLTGHAAKAAGHRVPVLALGRTAGQEHVGAIPGSGYASRGGLSGFAVQRAGMLWEDVAGCY